MLKAILPLPILDIRPVNKSQVEIQEISAGKNRRTQPCYFASAIKDGGGP
jgi:hypothetical protein